MRRDRAGGSSVDEVRLRSLARQAAARFRTDPWYDDIAQAALIACWEHEHRSDRQVVWNARNAAIDEWRRLSGRTSGSRQLRRPLPLYDVHTVEPPPLPPSVEYGADGRLGAILDCLHAGWTGRDIAAALDLHESRISQLARRFGRTVTR